MQNSLLVKKHYFANTNGESKTLKTYNSYTAEASVSALPAHVDATQYKLIQKHRFLKI